MKVLCSQFFSAKYLIAQSILTAAVSYSAFQILHFLQISYF